jgi:hypothetical protein
MIQVLTTPPNVLWVKPIGDTKSAIDSYDFPATCSRARNVCRVDAASWAFSAPSEERNCTAESHRNVWHRRTLPYRAPTVLKLSWVGVAHTRHGSRLIRACSAGVSSPARLDTRASAAVRMKRPLPFFSCARRFCLAVCGMKSVL